MVRWAPLKLPLRRRLQTAAVLVTICILPASITVPAARVSAILHDGAHDGPAVPGVDPLHRQGPRGACRLPSSIAPRRPSLALCAAQRGGRPRTWFQNLRLWRLFGEYFPAQLHMTTKLDPNLQYFFGLHPHGIIGMSLWPTLILPTREIRDELGVPYSVLTVSASFRVPFWREMVMAAGMVDASRESTQFLLEHGRSVMVVVGGALEALYARPGSVDITLLRRKGFVRLALMYGAQLVPVYSFGENELYDQAAASEQSLLRRLQLRMLSVLGWTLPLFRGRGVFQYTYGFMPHRHPVHTVVGAPILVERVAEPTREQVDALHARYCEALVKLFEDNRDKYGGELYRDKTLKFVH